MARSRYIILLAVLLAPAWMGLARSSEPDPRTVEAREQVAALDQLHEKYRELSARADELKGAERDVVILQMRQSYLEFMGELDALVTNIVAFDEEGIGVPDLRTRVQGILSGLSERFPPFIDGIDGRTAELRSLLAEAVPEDIPKLEDRISDHERSIDQVYKHYAAHLRYLRSLGLSVEGVRRQLEKRIIERAETLTGRLALEKRRLTDAERRAGEGADDPELERAVRDAQQHVSSLAKNLSNACDVMDAVDLETADCRELLIRTTGEVTRDVLDRKVVAGLLDSPRVLAALEASRRLCAQGRVEPSARDQPAGPRAGHRQRPASGAAGGTARGPVPAGHRSRGTAGRTRHRRLHRGLCSARHARQLCIWSHDSDLPTLRRRRFHPGRRNPGTGERDESRLDDGTDARQPDPDRSQ